LKTSQTLVRQIIERAKEDPSIETRGLAERGRRCGGGLPLEKQ
jgi:hypothetical protein